MPQGQVLSDHAAKRHTNNIHGIVTEGIQQGCRVIGILFHCIRAIRFPGLPKAALVVGDNVMS
jgi:hypothetical protein